MKPFSFRLERILNYRDYLEKRAQRNLFNARHEYAKQRNTVKGLAKERAEIARRCRDEGFRGISVPLYQIYSSFLQTLRNDLETAHGRLEKGEEKVKAQEAVLKEESIKKKTLETLRDLRLKRYREGLEREEQKAMDELAIIRRGVQE